jgi:hypothetical protein
MNQNVQKLKSWLDGLSPTDREEVLRFMYGRLFVKKEVTINDKKTYYAGPAPGLIDINEGYYAGPAPSTSQAQICPTCKRLY